MAMETFDLSGKVAIVTGAGKGLGLEMTLALAKAGANIVAASRTQSRIDAIAHQVEGLGVKAIAIATDVRDSSQVERLVRARSRNSDASTSCSPTPASARAAACGSRSGR